MVLDLNKLIDIPKTFAQYILIPIQYGIYKTSNNISKQIEMVFLARYAAKERAALREQLAVILSENANLRKNLAQKQSLVDQEKALNTQTFNLIPARPLGVSRYLKIDKGSNDGLKEKLAVVYKDNLIGEIKTVSPKMSEVILITDPDFKISAFASSERGKAKGILEGEFGALMDFTKILHSEPISKGDLVYSDGIEGKFPRGLILGQVKEVLEETTQIFKQAKVEPVFDISDLDLVFVIAD